MDPELRIPVERAERLLANIRAFLEGEPTNEAEMAVQADHLWDIHTDLQAVLDESAQKLN